MNIGAATMARMRWRHPFLPSGFLAAPAVLMLALLPSTLTANAQPRATRSSAAAPWKDITPGPGLAGWRATGGEAQYEVRDGELIGG
ncbi:hypothetical protein AB5I41_07215 [Sphingomonas sp. MMS24-JH45]